MDELIGYTDVWSARAGARVSVHLHAARATDVTVDLVDLTSAANPDDAAHVAAVSPVSCQAGPQTTAIGSYATLPLGEHTSGVPLTVVTAVRLAARRPGVVLAVCVGSAVRFAVHWDGVSHLTLRAGGSEIRVATPLRSDVWTHLAMRVDPTRCALATHTSDPASAQSCEASDDQGAALNGALTLWLSAMPGTAGQPTEHLDAEFDGVAACAEWLALDRLQSTTAMVAMIDRPSMIGHWDFSRSSATDVLEDLGPHRRHGRTFQGPTRLMPGVRWVPGVLDPARDRAQFSAIHFHSDDLLDAAWSPSATVVLPATLPSGVYGVRARSASQATIDVIPIWVRAAHAADARPLAFLAPTYTYLAYGNAPDEMLGPMYWGGDHRAEDARRRHPEYGPSLYSRHPDYSGVVLASRRRPLLSVRPGVRPWGFEADRLLTDWLQRHDHRFDVLTDEDVDREGRAALDAHRVIVSGNHPEYWSATMLEALDAWLRDGGRFVYLGGNGLYWRVSSLASLPGVIECRRAEGGTRPWIAEPGTYHHQMDDAPGGLWRRLGRPPQALVGVGFAAQGFPQSAPYGVIEAARESWAGFALEGVASGLVGTTGLFGGGAAGQEIDRYDVRLGSRPDAVVIASSAGLHDASMLRTVEELLSHELPAPDSKVRADLTLTALPGGGGVFAAGSMAFVGALDDPGIAQILSNVLSRFGDPTPLAGPATGGEPVL
jgi:N,N-dimethylformamidase